MPTRVVYPALFPSFLMGGFESSTFLDRAGQRVDYIRLTQHDRFAREDYERARAAGLGTIREALRWYLCDRDGAIDLSSFTPFALTAQELGLAQINCLFHYGYPDDLHPFDERFVPRLAKFAEAVARWRVENIDPPRWYGVANEISLFAWAGGDVGWFGPHLYGSGARLKRVLVQGALEATDAIRAVDSQARFVSIDPAIHRVPPPGDDALSEDAARENRAQYEAWDLMLGRIEPALGGRADSFQVLGVNCYPDTQTELGTRRELALDDPRRKPLRVALQELWKRYQKPIIMAETSARGPQRPRWLRYIVDEIIEALRAGVDVQGICLFPLVDMREWKGGVVGQQAHLGLWDVLETDAELTRVPNEPYLAALSDARTRLAESGLLPGSDQ